MRRGCDSVSKMTQDEHESERNEPGRNNKRTVGETEVNEKIGKLPGLAAVGIKLIKYRHQNGIAVPGKQTQHKKT